MSDLRQTLSLDASSHRRRRAFLASTPTSLELARATAREERSDLQRRVVSSLSSLGYAALTRIECEATRERIVLVGSVSSYHLKQTAQTAALRVAGRFRVDNRIVVTTP